MIFPRIWRWIPVLALAGLVLIGGGCAEKITGPAPTSQVSVSLNLKAGPAVSFQLTVSGADMDTVVSPMGIFEDQVAAQITIPSGEGRHFLVEAFDQFGTVLYLGETVLDVTGLQPLDLTIDMLPVAPMIYLIPHISTVKLGDSFTLTVCVNDLPGLSGAGIGLSLRSLGKGAKLLEPAAIDTVIIDPDQQGLGSSLQYSLEGGSSVYFSLFNEGPIVNEAGDACLLTIHCRTQDTWPDEDLFLYPMMFIETLSGVDMNLDDIHLDSAQIQLVRDRTPESYLGSDGDDSGVALVPLGNGDTMLAGVTLVNVPGSEIPLSSLYLARLGADLQPLSDPTFLPWSSLHLTTGFAPATGGGYYAVGLDVQGSSEVVFVNENSTENWREDLGGSRDAFAIASRPGGGSIVAGRWPNDGYHFYLAAVEASGALVHFEPTNFSFDQEFRAVVALDDNTFIAAGTQRAFSAGGQNIVLGKYSLTEGISMVFEYPLVDSGDQAAGDLLVTQDGGFLIVGGTNNGDGGPFDVRVVKTDAEGGIEWVRTFGTFGDDFGTAVTRSTDGGYVVTGYTGALGGPRDVMVAKLTAGGDLVWQRVHGGPDDEFAQDIIPYNSGYLITGTGSAVPNQGRDILLLHLSGEGDKLGE